MYIFKLIKLTISLAQCSGGEVEYVDPGYLQCQPAG